MTMKRLSVFMLLVTIGTVSPSVTHAQVKKEINEQTQLWVSINSTTRVTHRWGLVGDFHMRRNDFAEDPSFYFIRLGSHFWITEKFTLTAGYAHMFRAPLKEDWHTWSDENRIYEQFQYSSKIGSVSVLSRFRNEQRWQEEVKNDVLTGKNLFSDRMRYLLSFSIPVSKNPHIPLLVLSDEILLQFGKNIVLNTFDQNRFFVGIKKNVTPALSFDFGYMPVYQQKSSGYQYDLNHTIRCFFYYTPDFTKKKSHHEPASHEE